MISFINILPCSDLITNKPNGSSNSRRDNMTCRIVIAYWQLSSETIISLLLSTKILFDSHEYSVVDGVFGSESEWSNCLVYCFNEFDLEMNGWSDWSTLWYEPFEVCDILGFEYFITLQILLIVCCADFLIPRNILGFCWTSVFEIGFFLCTLSFSVFRYSIGLCTELMLPVLQRREHDFDDTLLHLLHFKGRLCRLVEETEDDDADDDDDVEEVVMSNESPDWIPQFRAVLIFTAFEDWSIYLTSGQMEKNTIKQYQVTLSA